MGCLAREGGDTTRATVPDAAADSVTRPRVLGSTTVALLQVFLLLRYLFPYDKKLLFEFDLISAPPLPFQFPTPLSSLENVRGSSRMEGKTKEYTFVDNLSNARVNLLVICTKR